MGRTGRPVAKPSQEQNENFDATAALWLATQEAADGLANISPEAVAGRSPTIRTSTDAHPPEQQLLRRTSSIARAGHAVAPPADRLVRIGIRV